MEFLLISSFIFSKRKYLIVGEPRVIFFENKSKFTLKNHSLPKFLIFLSWRVWKLSGNICGGFTIVFWCLSEPDMDFDFKKYKIASKNYPSLAFPLFWHLLIWNKSENLFWILCWWLNSFLLREIIEIGREPCVIFFENKSKFTF